MTSSQGGFEISDTPNMFAVIAIFAPFIAFAMLRDLYAGMTRQSIK